jgi:diguanylate cyclase (GGDEF)-like protein/PAS domain S-box-containing protein
MSPHARLHLVAGLVCMLTLGAIGTFLWQAESAHREMRRSTLQEAERRSLQLAGATGTQIEQLVRGVDLALQQLQEDYGVDDKGFERTVQSVLGTLGGTLERVTVFDANGQLAYASTGQVGPVDISDREHFRFHADSGENRLHISAPVLSRVTGRWVILMSRPILRQDKFVGVVIIDLFPQQLSAQLARLVLEPNDVVVLLRGDGKFLARSRDWEKHMGKEVRPGRPFMRPGAPAEGTFRAPGSVDEVPRIFAWHWLPDRQLMTAVGLAESSLLAPQEKEEAKEHARSAAVALMLLLLGGGTTLLLVRVARQQRDLAGNEERYRRLHESMVDAYARVGMDGKLVEWNRSYEQMLGYSSAELAAKTYRDLTPPRWHEMEARILAEEVIPKGYSGVYEKEYVRSDGTVFPVELRVFLLRDDNQTPIGMWAIVRDITERKLVEAQIHHLAHHDALTGLPNRAALNLRLEQAITAAQREGHRLAVMLIDLDRFKGINDNLGHLVGDQLLVEVAHRLRTEVRGSDIVARLGGDEFIVVVSEVASTQDIEAVAQKIRGALSKPYVIESHELHTTPSIGISFFPKDGSSAEALIRHADAAMYQAKAQGRDNWQFYNESISLIAAERLKIENGLRGALQRGEFILHYQPQLDLASQRIVAVEALVRWQHPDMGLVAPDRFIPVAEDMGLIVPLGEWVLNEACAQLRRWRDAGLAGLRMCVNLSARQLQKQTLHDSVAAALARHGLAAADLELEITESMAMSNPAETIGTLKKLEALGVTLAIDDFGTGYSSLSYLKLLPIHRLKLDRSFVGDIETDPDDASICRATASLCHDLGLTLVAEGVESEAQFAFIKGLGCDLLQGDWLAPALPAAEARDMIVRHHSGAR